MSFTSLSQSPNQWGWRKKHPTTPKFVHLSDQWCLCPSTSASLSSESYHFAFELHYASSWFLIQSSWYPTQVYRQTSISISKCKNKINAYFKRKSLLKLLTCQHFWEFPLLWFARKITVYATLIFESIRNVLGLWRASIQRQSVVIILCLHYWVIVSIQDPQSSHSLLPAIHHRLVPQTHLPGSFSIGD